MTKDGDPPDAGDLARRQRFTLSLAKPPLAVGFRDLGITPLALQLGLTAEQTNGHWCSRCQGIWFGYTLEAQCPVCGNRHG
jgi:hypothetical protein